MSFGIHFRSVASVALVKEASFILNKMHSLDGFEKGIKAMISNIAFLNLFPSCRGVFDGCIETFKDQKNLYYAAKVFSVPADYVHLESKKTDKREQSRSYTFCLPRYRHGGEERVNWEAIFLGIGSFGEMGRFLQQHRLCAFSALTQLSSKIGAVRVFSSIQGGVLVNNIPVVHRMLNSPKDGFVFAASCHGLYKSYHLPKDKFWTIENYVKMTGCIGKIILIGFGGMMEARGYKGTVKFIDMFYSNVAVIGLIWKLHLSYHKNN